MPLSYREGLLTFSCSDRYKVGKTAKVKLTLVYAERIDTPTVSVTVVSFELNEDGTYVCAGALQLEPRKLPELVMRLAYAGVDGADRRGSRRLPYTIRILSRELSSFRAVTSNINLTGVELVCEGPVATGHFMNLQFDLESVGEPELKMQAVAMWSVEEVDESRKPRYRVGVGFTSQNHRASQAAWAKFYQRQLSSEGESVLLKTMDGGSITEKRPELNQDERPDAASSGQWPSPQPANPFAQADAGASGSFQPPASPQQPGGGFSFPSPGQNPFGQTAAQAQAGFGGFASQQPPAGSGLNFIAPAADVPQPHQMGGGFASQAAPPPPLAPNKLKLTGAPQPPPSKLSLPDSGASYGGFGSPAGQQPAAGGGFGFAPPPSPPQHQQQQGFGFPAPQPPQASGFQLPPSPGQGGFGAPPPFAPPGQGGFGAPPGAGGFGVPPASSSGGFSLPPTPPSPPQQGFGGSSGFGSPPVAGAPAAGGYGSPPAFSPPSAASSGGFQIPTPPSAASSGGFSIPAAQPPATGFSFPPASPPAGGLNFPPAAPTSASSGGFPMPSAPQSFGQPPAAQQPEQVEPLGINGANLAYRCRSDASNAPGARKQVQLSFNLGGQVTRVVIGVSLTRVEASPDGRTVCWATVLEDAQKVQVLNQLLAR